MMKMEITIDKGIVDIEYPDYAIAFLFDHKGQLVFTEWFKEEGWNSPLMLIPIEGWLR